MYSKETDAEFVARLFAAYEKQKPKPPKRTDAYPHSLYCANCGWTFFYNEDNKMHGMFKFCPECGQAILWEAE